MQAVRDLVSLSNTYYQEKVKAKEVPNAEVLSKIAKYITNLMRTFGVFPNTNAEIGHVGGALAGGKSVDDVLLPYLRALSSFRDAVRDLAQKKGGM